MLNSKLTAHVFCNQTQISDKTVCIYAETQLLCHIYVVCSVLLRNTTYTNDQAIKLSRVHKLTTVCATQQVKMN